MIVAKRCCRIDTRGASGWNRGGYGGHCQDNESRSPKRSNIGRRNPVQQRSDQRARDASGCQAGDHTRNHHR